MKLNKLKDQAWAYYKTWMQETTFCPILHKEVKVTRTGWDHLLNGARSRRRKSSDKYRRLKLLKAAKHVIKSAESTVIKRNYTDNFISIAGTFHGKGEKPIRLRVILKKDPLNQMYFYSVMEA